MIQMVEYFFIGVLTIADRDTPDEWNWEVVQEVSKYIAKLAAALDYYIRLRGAPQNAIYEGREPYLGEFDTGYGERDMMQLMWKRMPLVEKGQYRLFFMLQCSPVDDSIDNAVTSDLRPSIRAPLDEALSESGESGTGIRMFRFLKGIWERAEVVNGVFAIFDWDLEWPDLDEYKLTFEEFLTEMYHFHDPPNERKRGLRAASYFVEK